MVELDHQRSVAKTLVNKMGLDQFVLFNIFNFCWCASFSDDVTPNTGTAFSTTPALLDRV